MSRTRSITIYAENQSDYSLVRINFHINISQQLYQSRINSLFQRNDKRFKSVYNFIHDDDTNNEDALGCDSGYKIVKRELTFTEKEEETELENEISNLQLQKQHRLHLGYDISDEEDGHQTQDEEEENEKDILYYR